MLVKLAHQDGCKKSIVITDDITGEITCSNCGVVLAEKYGRLDMKIQDLQMMGI
ncbi:transcription factor TFIIB cyclin-related protein [Candidatus Nitrosarchaeum limnium]|uniref:Transcription initiation factor IIB n=1 Tax=Candidatus Nitrosarchaeum limnium BG20 TaxID=859192 RepID=S2EQF8_9ARCH|nr:transcription factor TFIIB cyclin-related protein [Candidatus Nitrosarchaeum limnium]EPA06667.1 hypothetical protein BG20_I2482 [Candidatus Nitrosarchaeum limnium BG20]